MRKFFYNLWNDYKKNQQALAEMGIVQITVPAHGAYIYVDQVKFEKYLQNMKNDNH